MLKILVAEMGPAKALETEWIDLVSLALGPQTAGGKSV